MAHPTRSTAARFLSPTLLLSAVLCALPRDTFADGTKESWVGIYLNGRKIGYTSLFTEPTTYKGKPAIKMTSKSVTNIELFGTSVSQNVDSLTITDSGYRPMHSEFNIESKGSATKLTAEYEPGKILCTVDSGGSPQKREVTVPAGANLAADATGLVPGKKMAVGQKLTIYYLEPMTISLMKSDMTVMAEENVELNGTQMHTFRVVATSPIGPLTTWETADGDMLKGEAALGMSMFSESKDAAMNMKSGMPRFAVVGSSGTKSAYIPPKDFALATAVKVDKPIPNPRAVRSLSLQVSGVDDPKLVISDARQRVTRTNPKDAGYLLRVTADRFDPAASAKLPITEPSVQDLLKPAPYLETQDHEIRKLAAELRGTETNAYDVAVRIHDWVHEHMAPDYTIGVPRSCVEINSKRRGVCRDYATLFAGIARAAGIPTRVCGGMVYAEGKFFYHAWAECWVGRWVAFDPTMAPSNFVDATHVKFAQGDVTDMFRVAGVVGRVVVHVVAVQ